VDPVLACELCDVNLSEGTVYMYCCRYDISDKIRIPRSAFLLGEFGSSTIRAGMSLH
jgi:hypothetical protein